MVHLVLSNFPFDFFDPRDYSSQPPIQLAEILSEFSVLKENGMKLRHFFKRESGTVQKSVSKLQIK